MISILDYEVSVPKEDMPPTSFIIKLKACLAVLRGESVIYRTYFYHGIPTAYVKKAYVANCNLVETSIMGRRDND